MATISEAVLLKSLQDDERRENLIPDTDPEPRESFCCEICSEVFVTSEGYAAHISYHAEFEARFQVSESDVNQSDNEGHETSTGEHDGGSKQRKKPSRARVTRKDTVLTNRPVCEVCNKSFANHQVLTVHMRIHTGERPYACTICDRRFAQKNTLVGHMATHDRTQYVCEVCGMVYSHLRSLRYHMKYHTGERERKKRQNLFSEHEVDVNLSPGTAKTMFQCDICLKLFTTGNQLAVHRRIHTGERPYVCEICGQGFRQQITLKDHETTHTSGKPFECDKCGSKFKQRRILRQHRISGVCERRLLKTRKKRPAGSKSVTSAQMSENVTDKTIDNLQEKGQKVENVSKSVNEESDNEDLTTHISGKPFECEKCGSKFKQGRILHRHQMSGVCGKLLNNRKKRPAESESVTSAQVSETVNDRTIDNLHEKGQKEENLPKNANEKESDNEYLTTHVSGKPFECDKRGSKFKQGRILRRHQISGVCGKLLNKRKKRPAAVHLRIHTGERPYVCKICGQGFRQKFTLKDHETTHISGKPFECDKCGSKFKQGRILRQHQISGVCERRLLKKRKKRPAGSKSVESAQMSENVTDKTIDNLQEKGQKAMFQCDICLKLFTTGNQLAVHRRIHTGERPYVCEICGQGFRQKITLKDHETTHISGKPFECDKCGSKFKQGRILRQHQISGVCERRLLKKRKKRPDLPGERERKRQNLFSEYKVNVNLSPGTAKPKTMFQCDICLKLFTTGNHLEVHRRIHTGERPYVCKICGQGFRQKITLKDHETTHFSGKPFECDKCGSKFKQRRILRQHQLSEVCGRLLKNRMKRPAGSTSVTSAQVSENVRDRTIDNLQETGQKVENVSKSAKEEESDLPTEIDRCEESESEPLNEGECNSSQSNNSALASPNEDHPARSALLVCEHCDKVFVLKHTLRQHLQTHSVERPYVCSECNKGFRTKAFLLSHMESHRTDKPLSCDICQKQFKRAKCLQSHIGRNICTGIRPYICEVCNKSFMYPRFLKKHRCIITPPKVFECETCGKRFTRRITLTEHIRVHTGDRPFQCPVCNMSFAKRALLKNHILIHDKNKNHECPVCKKKFTLRTTMENHMAVHSFEKKHKCQHCHKAFKQPSSLRNHMKLKHISQSQSGGGAVPSAHEAYLCAHCGKMFRHLRWMEKHHCVVKGVERFECQICDEVFEKKQQLEVHSRIHTGERPYQCSECSWCFTQADSLKNHMVTHTGDKGHECDICGATFLQENSLQRHKLVIHTGVEPFMCGNCGLTFKYQEALKKHSASCLVTGTRVEQVEPRAQGVLPGPEMVESVPDVAAEEHTDLEQVVLDNILGNIERAMNGAGIEIKDNVQYEIVVGEANGEVTVHLGENPK